MSRILLLLPEVEGLERAIEWGFFWARILRGRLKVLVVAEKRLFHYGEVDPLASSASRKRFLAYLEEEEQKRVENLTAILRKKAGEEGIFYGLEICEETFEKALLKGVEEFQPDLIVWPLDSLGKGPFKGKTYHPGPYLRKISCNFFLVP